MKARPPGCTSSTSAEAFGSTIRQVPSGASVVSKVTRPSSPCSALSRRAAWIEGSSATAAPRSSLATTPSSAGSQAVRRSAA